MLNAATDSTSQLCPKLLDLRKSEIVAIDGALRNGPTLLLSDAPPSAPSMKPECHRRVHCRVGAGLAPGPPTDPYVSNSLIRFVSTRPHSDG